MKSLLLVVIVTALVIAVSPAVAEPPPVRRAWTAKLPGEATRGCAVDDERVYQGVRKGRGGLVALSRRTGKIVWTRWHGRMGVEAAPLLDDGRVIHGSFEGDVVALDAATGAERWRLSTGGGGLMSTPVAAGERLWVGFIGGIAAVDRETGTLLLRVAFPASAKVLGVGAGAVFVHSAADNALIAVDAQTGSERWRVYGPVIDRARGLSAGFQPERVVLDGDTLFVPTNVAETWALDVRTGKKRWGYEPEGMTFGVASAGDTVILTSSEGAPRKGWRGRVARVEKTTGLLVWRRDVPGSMLAVPLVVGDVVVVPTSAAGLVILGRGDGEDRARVPLSGAAYWSGCAATDGTVYVGHERRRLTAVR